MNNKKQEGFLEILRNERNVILYGCGSMSHRVLDILLNNGIVPSAMVDNSPARQGTTYKHHGFIRQIMGYEDIAKDYDDYALVLTVSIINAIEIKQQLLNLGEKHPIYHMQCPFKVDNVLYTPQNNEQEIQDYFADDLSKKIYKEYIDYKSTGNMFPMLQFVDGESYFDEYILDNEVKHCFVDCGCYTGDTISQFLLFCRNGYKKIVGMEIDPGNAKKAEQFAEYSRLKNVHILNMGVV